MGPGCTSGVRISFDGCDERGNGCADVVPKHEDDSSCEGDEPCIAKENDDADSCRTAVYKSCGDGSDENAQKNIRCIVLEEISDGGIAFHVGNPLIENHEG